MNVILGIVGVVIIEDMGNVLDILSKVSLQQT